MRSSSLPVTIMPPGRGVLSGGRRAVAWWTHSKVGSRKDEGGRAFVSRSPSLVSIRSGLQCRLISCGRQGIGYRNQGQDGADRGREPQHGALLGAGAGGGGR